MPSSTYILDEGPSSEEAGRLDSQHPVLLELTGGLLPKSISDHLSTLESPRIADVATGAATWLLDIATKVPPKSSLYGFDIDTAKFPPASQLPPNVTLGTANILEHFPEEHLGSFDLVHVRLLLYGLKKDEWAVAARNLATLLKPGGWLLWEETGYPSWVTLPPGKGIQAALEIDIRFAQKIGRDILHPTKLLSHVENAGFVDCTEKDHMDWDIFATDRARKVVYDVMSQALKGIVARGGMPGLTTEEDAKVLQKGVEEDIFSGERVTGIQFKWVWGRKGQ